MIGKVQAQKNTYKNREIFAACIFDVTQRFHGGIESYPCLWIK